MAANAHSHGPFDILIAGGRVVDGTGAPWVRADVGIIGDRIAAIGDLHAADATPTTGRLWLWRYIDARIFGSARFKAEATGNWPLPPGRYRVTLCVDDGFDCLATTRAFRVVAS